MLKVLTAVAILLVIIGIALLGKKLKRALRFKSANTPQKESIWIELVSSILVIFIATAYYIRKDPAADLYMWTGVLVFFLGGLMQLLARRQLRKQDNLEELLTYGFDNAKGLYAKIRHPSKTALLLLLAGYSLSLGSFWALVIWLVFFIPSLLFRINQEERALEDNFNERWRAYKSDTKRLIPGVL